MEIQEIPTRYEAFEQFNRDYEARHFQYADPNKRVADATLQMFLNWFPSLIRPVLKPGASALLDEPMRSALGWPESASIMKSAIALGLRSRSAMAHWLPDRRTPDFFSDQRHRSYPKGYQLKDLGPPGMLEDLNRPGDNTTRPPKPPTA
jgi:hypothetical protein